MKKLFAFLLVFCMVFSMLPAAAAAEAAEIASGTCGDDLTWVVTDDGTLTISGTGEMTSSPWRYNADVTVDIKHIVVEEGVTVIAANAFRENSALTSAVLPETLTTIGDSAFYLCEALTEIVIPSQVTSIGSNAFYNCISMTDIMFKGDAPSFGYTCFWKINATVWFPMGNETWTGDAFDHKGQENIIWAAYDPACLESKAGTWGENISWTFDDATGTLTFTGTGDMESTDSFAYYPWYYFSDAVTSVVIGDGITNVPEYAFYTYRNLESVTLSDDVKTLEPLAFMECYSLKQIRLPAALESIGYSCFSCAGLTEIEIPETVTSIGDSAFSETALTSVTVPGGAVLGWGVFSSCQQMKTAWIQEGVTELPMSTFSGCTALEAVYIPGSVTMIDMGVFSQCDSLTSIYFTGDFVTGLDDWTFNGMTLTAYYPADNETWTEDKLLDYGGTITWVPYEAEESLPCDDGHHVPEKNYTQETGVCAYCGIPCRTSGTTVWAIENDGTMIVYGTGENGTGEMSTSAHGWKSYADRITSLVVEDGVTGAIHSFDMLENLTTVYLSKDITSIEKGAFAVCSNLVEIKFPEALTSIGSCAFQGCVSLKEVHLPATLSDFGGRPFGGCTSLSGIWVDEENPYFTNDSYGVLFSEDGSQLVEAPGALSGHYTIPETVNYIEWAAFDGCKQLTGVEIPDGVTWLQMNLFENCTSLKSITIPASVNSIWVNAFMGCTGLESVTFEGNAPDFMGDCFQSVTATAYYPAGNETWTEDVMQDYGGNITWVAYAAPETVYTATWKYATTSLGGTINLNIYVDMSDSLVNSPDTFVRFTCAGLTTDVPMKEALESMDYGTLLYRFSLPLNAKQVSDTVIVQVMNGDEAVSTALEYSIMKYCVNRIAKSPDAAEVAACKALLNYAAAAQVYFDYNTDNLANATLSDEDKLLPTADVADYKSKVSGSEPGIKASEATLMVESVVTVRVYFKVSEGYSIDDYTFYVDGKEVQPQQNAKGYYIESEGIPAKNMDEMHTFTVGGLTVEYGPLCYVRNKLSSTDPVVLNMVNALYAYFKAAEAVLG